MGRLVLVVGPSGAGKDTLINRAREALGDDPRYEFVRRVVTRPADPGLEDHETMTPEAFAIAEEAGAFALSWEAHGLRYGIPIAIEEAMAAGRVVVANGSRRIAAEALKRYPKTEIILIDAPVDVRAARLASRGRETIADVSERLKREASVPSSLPVTRILNGGAVEPALAAFLDALGLPD
jgi:phosphonate metabolism protein PhnN/1,5-bisphosphokinase (PRPP-forming)